MTEAFHLDFCWKTLVELSAFICVHPAEVGIKCLNFSAGDNQLAFSNRLNDVISYREIRGSVAAVTRLLIEF